MAVEIIVVDHNNIIATRNAYTTTTTINHINVIRTKPAAVPDRVSAKILRPRRRKPGPRPTRERRCAMKYQKTGWSINVATD